MIRRRCYEFRTLDGYLLLTELAENRQDFIEKFFGVYQDDEYGFYAWYGQVSTEAMAWPDRHEPSYIL